MKGKINFLALLIGFQLLSLEAGIVIENITLIDAKNGTRTNQTVSIKNGVIQSIGSAKLDICLLYTSPSPRDATLSRMPSSA